MTSAKITAAALLSAMAVLPAAAQQAQTVPSEPPAPPPPPAWTVTADAAQKMVRISATAKDGAAEFAGACKTGQDGISGAFFRYKGGGLRADGQVEPVTLFAQGADWRDAFSARLRYVAGSRTWVLDKPLSPIFLGSFSRGATLTVANSRGEEVLTFDLTGSTAATRAMRTTCGLR